MLKMQRRILWLPAVMLVACSSADGPGVDSGPSAISLEPARSVLGAIGATVTLEVVDQAGRALTASSLAWRSADAGIVNVDSRGVVTAVSEGTTRVHATLGNLRDSADVTVRQTITTLSLTPPDTLTWLGKTLPLQVAVLDANGHPVTTAALSYSSSDNGVVTVTNVGVATARGIGSAVITVTAAGKSASVPVVVRQVGSVLQVTPAFAKLRVIGDTVRLRAVVQDSGGNVLPAQPVVTFTQEPGFSPIELAPGGLVRGALNGEAIVSARAGALTSSAKVLVNTRGAVRVSVRKAGGALPSRVGLKFERDGLSESRTSMLARDTVFHDLPPGATAVRFGFSNATACMNKDSILGQVNVVAADTVAFEVAVRCFTNILGVGETFPTNMPFINVLDSLDAFGADLRSIARDSATRFLSLNRDGKRLLVTNGTAISVLGLAAHSQKQAVPGILGTDRFVQWGPDGDRIVFLRDGGAVQDVRALSLMSIRPDGSDLQQLGTFTGTDGDLTVSLAGYAVATVTPGTGSAGIAVLRTGDTQLRVVPNIQYSGGLALSPDGTRVIYYVSASLDDTNVFVANTDGTSVLKLNTEPFSFRGVAAAWSPDGTLILYTGRAPDLSRSRVFVVNADGSDRRMAAELINGFTSPRFSNDGRYLSWVNDDVYIAPVDLSWTHVIMKYGEIQGQFYRNAIWLD